MLHSSVVVFEFSNNSVFNENLDPYQKTSIEDQFLFILIVGMVRPYRFPRRRVVKIYLNTAWDSN